MAGLSDVSAGSGLTPELIAKILASQETVDVGGNGIQRYYTDPATGQRWYSGLQNYGTKDAGDAISVDRNQLAAATSIGRDIPNPDGGKTAWFENYDLNGKLINRGQYDRSWKDMLQAIALVAPAVGGIVGAAGGATSAAGGAATTGGAAAGGASSTAAGGLSAVDSLLAGGGLGAETGTLVGGSALTSGGTATLGATVADAGMTGTLGGIMGSAGGGGLGIIDAGVGAATGSLGTAKDVVDAAKTTNDVKNAVDPAKNTKTAVDGWDALTKVGTGLVTSAVVGDALSDPVDTSRYDKLFDNLLNEQALASQRGKDLWADYTNIWKPAQEKFADTVMNYDTAGRREQAAQNASGLVATEYDQKRSAATRDMQMAGVDPSTIAALGASSQAWEAKDRAGAANAARDNVEKTGLSLLDRVVNQGNVVQNQATQQSQVATGATQAANSILNSQATQQNNNTQSRNELVGDLFSAGLQAAELYGKKG